jgi:outer membrane lipoprotein LolB
MRLPRRSLPLALVCVALLAGCQTQPHKEAPATQTWEARRSALQGREQFDLKARVAVAAGQEGFNARMRWTQKQQHSQLALDGPLGVGGAQIDFDGTALTVRTSRGQQLSDSAARSELAARLGFEPPLQSLRFWIQGVPDPAMSADEVLDDQQRLATLRQGDWQIDYPSYTNVSGQWLPQRMTLLREGVRVRLLVDAWGP